MLAEFIRIRPDPDTHLDLREQRAFLCELPDIREERSDEWRQCGHVIAAADRGQITRVSIELNNTMFDEIAEEGERFEPEEVARAVLLSLGWEKWLPMSRVSVKISGSQKQISGVYLVTKDKFTWQEKDNER